MWKDITSYRRSDVADAEPRTWELDLGDFSLIVTRRIHLNGWYGLLRGGSDVLQLGCSPTPLGEDLEEAKSAWCKRVSLGLDEMLGRIRARMDVEE